MKIHATYIICYTNRFIQMCNIYVHTDAYDVNSSIGLLSTLYQLKSYDDDSLYVDLIDAELIFLTPSVTNT